MTDEIPKAVSLEDLCGDELGWGRSANKIPKNRGSITIKIKGILKSQKKTLIFIGSIF